MHLLTPPTVPALRDARSATQGQRQGFFLSMSRDLQEAGVLHSSRLASLMKDFNRRIMGEEAALKYLPNWLASQSHVFSSETVVRVSTSFSFKYISKHIVFT